MKLWVNGWVKVGRAHSTRLRMLEEIRADILALERETEGLLDELLGE